MITLKNSSAVLVISFLSMIFLVSSAWADDTWSDMWKSWHHEQKENSDHREKPKQQQSPQSQSAQEKHRDQGMDPDHDGDIDRDDDREGHHHKHFKIIRYVYIIPVQNRVYYNTPASSVGTFVDSLPADHLTVIINDETYAVYQGIFYRQTFSGYEVIDPSTLVSSGSFSISITNSKGGYTPIQMQAVGNGFIGPQGEFYPQFPSIRQLQAMYVQ